MEPAENMGMSKEYPDSCLTKNPDFLVNCGTTLGRLRLIISDAHVIRSGIFRLDCPPWVTLRRSEYCVVQASNQSENPDRCHVTVRSTGLGLVSPYRGKRLIDPEDLVPILEVHPALSRRALSSLRLIELPWL